DDEKRIERELTQAQEKWEEDSKLHREIVSDESVADVVSMMSGVPVTRIAQAESSKLAQMPDLIKGKVIGQDNAVAKVVKAIRSDDEKRIERELTQAQEKWEEDSKLHREIVSDESVADVVSMMSGVPVTRIAQAESSKLAQMPDLIKGKVIGQDNAVAKVVKAIQRNRAGLKDPDKPIGSFIFLGQPGVG